MSDVVKGLREAASGKGGLDYGDLWAYCDEAADEIERLEAELAEARRERDALREMVDSTKVAAWDKCAEIIRRAQTAEAERDALREWVKLAKSQLEGKP